MVGVSRLDGINEFFDGKGVKFAPLGFGFQADWEVIEKKVVTASVATVELGVDTFDPAEWDEIEITVDQLYLATDNVSLNFTVSDDNGATFEAGTGYEYAWSGSRADTGIRLEAHAQGAALWEIYNSWGGVSTDNHFLKMTGGRMDHADGKAMYWALSRWDGNIVVNLHGAGAFDGNTNALNAFRFVAASGNIDGGRFFLRGRRKTPVSLISQDDWVVIEDRTGISASVTEDFFWDDQVYDEIEVTISGLEVNTDAQDVDILLSTDGSTFHSGATDYKWAIHNSNDVPASGESGSIGTDALIGFAPNLGDQADEFVDATIRFRNVSGTTRKKTCRFEWTGQLNDAVFYQNIGGGILMVTNDSLRGFRLDGEGATTINADRIRVRGRRLTPTGVLKQDWEIIRRGNWADDSSGANFDLISLPSAEFYVFELEFEGVLTDTSGNGIWLRFSNDNGATFDSGANYDEVGERFQPAGNTAESLGAQSEIQFINNFGAVSDRGANGAIRLHNMGDTHHKYLTGSATMSLNDSDDATMKIVGGVWFGTGSAAAIHAFRCELALGGNYTAGTYVLRGRRRA